MDLPWSGFVRWAGDNWLLPGDGTKTSTKNKRACWRRCEDFRMGCVGFFPVIFNIHFLQTAASCFVVEPFRHYALTVIQRCETLSFRMQKPNWHCKDFWEKVVTTLDSGLKTTPNQKQSYRHTVDALNPALFRDVWKARNFTKAELPTTHGREGPHLHIEIIEIQDLSGKTGIVNMSISSFWSVEINSFLLGAKSGPYPLEIIHRMLGAMRLQSLKDIPLAPPGALLEGS